MSELVPTDRQLFFSKNDPQDPRLGEMVAKGQADVSIIGYPDDEGIHLNGGIRGAASGPAEIRRWLYRTTPHAHRKIKTFTDAGDISIEGTLEERHNRALNQVAKILEQQGQVLSLGGGNDYAFPDGAAFLQTYEDKKPLVINIDAHFDVRDLSRGLNSGTPFFRLLEGKVPFEFVELGIQAQCNSAHHWQYVEKKGGKIITMEEMIDSGKSPAAFVTETMGESLLRRRPAYVALDIDAVAWPFAMGASASWPLGLDPKSLWSLLQLFFKRLDVRVFGIYEVSPPLDQGAGTAKLAAQLAHGFLHHV